MDKDRILLTQNNKAAYRVIDGEAVIVDLDSNELYSLNSVATLIWEMSDGSRTIKEIVDRIEEEFEVDRVVAEEDCLEFVQDFIEKGLLIAERNGQSVKG